MIQKMRSRPFPAESANGNFGVRMQKIVSECIIPCRKRKIKTQIVENRIFQQNVEKNDGF